jgi:microcystin-dependent protein
MKTNLLRIMLQVALVMLAAPLLVWPVQAANGNPPEFMTYQGYVTDGNGNPLGSTNTGPKNYDVIFRIWNDQVSTDTQKRLWTEQQTITVDNGYFSVLLGEGTSIGETRTPMISTLFTNVDASDRFIELTVKGIGPSSSDVTIAPRLRLLSSPYAFLARTAVNAQALANGAAAQIVTVTSTNVGINKTSPSSALDVNGTMTATGLTVNGPASFNSSVTMAMGAWIPGTSVLEFGKGLAGKDVNAGKIGYQWYDGGLNISGAGPTGHRVVSILAEDGTVTFGGVGVNRGSVGAGYMLDVNGAARVTSLTSSNTVTAVSFVGNGTIPIGGIIMWSGAISNIPAGWALCNGATVYGRVTPNLLSRFVVGAGSDYNVGDIGGTNSVTLSVNQIPAHSHTYNTRAHAENAGGLLTDHWEGIATANTGQTGGGQAHENRPPYYALAYIMRVQ